MRCAVRVDDKRCENESAFDDIPYCLEHYVFVVNNFPDMARSL